MPSVAEIVEVLDTLYDPRLAADWDAIGLVCGHPARQVDRVLFAVDPVHAVVEEALDWRADLIVTHHPLFLRPVHGVAATTPKGKVVHKLVTNGMALHVCHTNADTAVPGVSDALARALGLVGQLRPIDPVVVPGPTPAVGAVAAGPPRTGIGRIGQLPEPEPLHAFAARVAQSLPKTAHGVRVAGDPHRMIRTVAVSGGAGDSYLDAVRQADPAIDAYVTADLRHHPASEFGEHEEPPALIDVAHWASEWPWLATAAAELTRALGERGTTVETRVSAICTDPWKPQNPGSTGGPGAPGQPSPEGGTP